MKCDGVSDCVVRVSDSELGLCNGGNYLAQAGSRLTQSVLRIPRYCDTGPGITPGYFIECPGARAESCPLQTLISDHRVSLRLPLDSRGPGCRITSQFRIKDTRGKERGRGEIIHFYHKYAPIVLNLSF